MGHVICKHAYTSNMEIIEMLKYWYTAQNDWLLCLLSPLKPGVINHEPKR